MKLLLKACLLLCICVWFSIPAYSQSFTLWGEAGSQQTKIGNGETNRTDFGYGGGITAIFTGKSTKKGAFLIPIGFEFRSDKDLQFKDFVIYGDAAIRIRNFSFGPGVNFSYLSRGDVRDSNCTDQKVSDYLARNPNGHTSCLQSDRLNPLPITPGIPRYENARNGFRQIGEFFGTGISGFGKYNFGPQGRAFVQGRYIYYHPDWVQSISKEGLANQFSSLTGGGFAEPTDFPEFRKGRDLRLSGGYVFGGEGIAKIIRAQYVDRQFDFRREEANINGVFNQKTRQFTVGFGIVF